MARSAKGDGMRKTEGTQMVDSSQKDQHESSNPSSERAKSNTEVTAELTNVAFMRRKMLKNAKPILRRSQRIQNTTLCTQGHEVEPVIENIDESDSDEEDHQCSYEEQKTPEAVLGARSLEEKIDYLVTLLEAQEKALEALKSKEVDRFFPSQSVCFTNIRSEVKKYKYKNMYIDSQKKIESLRDENYQLAKKLENAIGKLEGYEKGQAVFSGAIEKLKDAVLIPSPNKITETTLDVSLPRALISDCAAPTILAEAKPPTAKRRKLAKAIRRE